jgi:hypothetical protein
MIIGVLGLIGSGKGTVSDILVSKGFVKESFAAPVKDAVSAIFGWDRAMLEGDTTESREFREKKDEFWSDSLGYDITPRLALQLMGTESGREVFGEDLWVQSLLRRASQNENTVIADVRFPNEIEAIRKAGGHLVCVQRGQLPDWYFTARAANDPNFLHAPEAHDEMKKLGIHLSEWAWIGHKDIEYCIINDFSLEDLKEETEKMLHCFS